MTATLSSPTNNLHSQRQGGVQRQADDCSTHTMCERTLLTPQIRSRVELDEKPYVLTETKPVHPLG